MLGRKLVVLSLLAFGVTAVACLDDASPIEDNGVYTGAQSACSTGPAYANDTQFAAGPAQSDQPVCVPRCGTHPTLAWALSSGKTGGPSPTLDAVPSGTCSYPGEACSMVAVRSCCPGKPGEGLLVECHCVNGTWSCAASVAAELGAVVCAACTDDAAPDAGTTDAGADAAATATDAGDAGDAGN